jgi:hypothetical protein
MTFEEATREAARAATDAVRETMAEYKAGHHRQEEAITGVLLGSIRGALNGHRADGLSWTASTLTNRGKGAEEKKYGADVLIHVTMTTPTQNYSKGVLVQAKRVEPGISMFPSEHRELVSQCGRMLDVTPAAFVFDYARGSMRCGAASRIAGSTRTDLYDLCGWTPYRFFLELFRCPIGDPRFKSATLVDLPVPNILKIAAEGELSIEPRLF